MAKLTLSFKGHLIAIHHLDEGCATIGRDLACEIPIDSLAVAPRHAQILAHADGYSITAIDPAHPVILNSEKVEQAPLHHGDLIRIGKHTLHYAEAAQEVAVMPTAGAGVPGAGPGQAARSAGSAPDLTYVQIQSGRRLGRILALHHGSIRLTVAGADLVVITRRGDDDVLVCAPGATRFGINGLPAQSGAEIRLDDGALIEVDDLRCQYFSGRVDPP
ncbi:MAG TPA: FHA domain-containing protein [Chromatiaceae bacterium]|nr:FHA domain-containing protein [Chromatiaceae bacterium]